MQGYQSGGKKILDEKSKALIYVGPVLSFIDNDLSEFI